VHEDAGRSRKLASAGACDRGALRSAASVVQGHPRRSVQRVKFLRPETWTSLRHSQKPFAPKKSQGLIHNLSPSNSSAPGNSATHSQSFFNSLHCSGFSSTPSLRASYGSNCNTRRSLATTSSCQILRQVYCIRRDERIEILSCRAWIIEVAQHVERMHLP
jgi:hypothetical protein